LGPKKGLHKFFYEKRRKKPGTPGLKRHILVKGDKNPLEIVVHRRETNKGGFILKGPNIVFVRETNTLVVNLRKYLRKRGV